MGYAFSVLNLLTNGDTEKEVGVDRLRWSESGVKLVDDGEE